MSYSLDDLLYLMARLRKPESGCPWDLKQDFRSITPSTIEEAYEVVDAIEREDFEHLREELGDLLFQVVFYGQLATEKCHFTFADIIDTLTAKLIRRHPHVFPDGTLTSEVDKSESMDETQVKASWEAIKERERISKGNTGVFDDVPLSLPAITRAAKLQKRAAKHGFDWSDKMQVFAKLEEELGELRAAIDSGDNEEMGAELADLMFTCVNMARHLKKDPESLMRQANATFEKRFRHVEAQMAQSSANERSEHTLNTFWERAKRETS